MHSCKKSTRHRLFSAHHPNRASHGYILILFLVHHLFFPPIYCIMVYIAKLIQPAHPSTFVLLMHKIYQFSYIFT